LPFSDENLATPIQNELPWRIEMLSIRFFVDPELIKPFSIQPSESISVPVSIRDNNGGFNNEFFNRIGQ